MSNSRSFCTPVTGASARSAPHRPHAAAAHATVSSGQAAWRSVEDCASGCFPRPRPPRSRRDRSRGYFLYGLSDDGGLDDVEESLPSRRSSTVTRPLSSANRASTAYSAAPAAALGRHQEDHVLQPAQRDARLRRPLGNHRARVLHHGNSGRTWTPAPQGRSFTPLGTSLDFVSARTEYACAPGADATELSPSVMYLTTDSGRTWVSFTPRRAAS